jgi:hypothetical protein
MAIVLAIEPDRRQAAHLSAILKHQVDAELVIADTTEGALDAIGNRVPDLVLVPALLSPQDDAALAAALRVIAVAAHVRTLTIPVLASGVKHTPVSGMLAKWRKKGAASPEPDGCDPAVFGEQISAYLKEAAAERAQLEEDELLNSQRIATPAPMATMEPELQSYTPSPVVYTEEVHLQPSYDSWSMEPERQPYSPAPVVYTEEAHLQPSYDSWSVEAEAVPAPIDDPIEESSMDSVEEPVLDLSNDLDEISETMSTESFDGEPVGVYTITEEADTAVFDAFDLMPGLLEPPSIKEEVEAALDQIAASGSAPAPRAPAERQRPTLVRVNPARLEPASVEPAAEQIVSVERTDSPRADITPWVPMYLTPGRMWPPLEGVPAETPAARSEQPDWIELVASLRQDLERRRTDPAAVAEPIAIRPSDGATATTHRLVKKPRPQVRKANPVQDEWGFFDPERCGFSTLLAKLEEITEEDART